MIREKNRSERDLGFLLHCTVMEEASLSGRTHDVVTGNGVHGYVDAAEEGGANGDQRGQGLMERRITILYMTATGTSEDVALRVARQARRRNIFHCVTVCDVASYDVTDLVDETLVVFVVSTAGQGEFPPVASHFWQLLLRKSLPPDILTGVTFAAFGLGDSSYPRFCWPVRLLSRRLRGLGAHELLDHGEADESHYLGLEASLQPWLDTLWSHLRTLLPLPSGTTEIGRDDLLPPTVHIRVVGQTDSDEQGEQRFSSHLQTQGWNLTNLLKNQRMTDEKHFQDVRLVEFSRRCGRTDAGLPGYEPGDVLCLHPQNDAAAVADILARLEYASTTRVTVQGDVVPSTVPRSPHTITLQDLFTYHLDFTAVPRQSFFEQIRLFSGEPGSLEREKLDEYCGIFPPNTPDANPQDGIDEMFEYAQRPRRTIKEVLDEFKSVRIPMEYIADVMPWIKPREFSIASSPREPASKSDCLAKIDVGGEEKVQLAVALVKYKTRLRKTRTGLCTRWLSTLAVNASVPVLLKKGYLTLPPANVPLILIGPGTGCAPIRSLVLHRLDGLISSATPIHLFLGFRNRDKDYLFGHDWDTIAQQVPETVFLHTAFSRDGEAKVYVQDLILGQAAVLWHAIFEQNAHIIVAGASGKMPEQVRAAFESIATQQANMDADQAKRFIDMLERQKRWQEECWS